MHRHRVILLLLLAPLVGPVLDRPADGQARAGDRAARVKAAYLLNFVRFSTWPPESFADREGERAPIVIVMLGDDREGIADLLVAIVGDELVHDRAVVVRRRPLPRARDRARRRKAIDAVVRELESAHLLYIEASLKREVPGLLRRVGKGLLTVSDGERFAARGGMLGLVREGTRIVFEANAGAIERSGVRVSSKILRLARIVDREDG